MRNTVKTWVVLGVNAALIAVPFATSALAQEYFQTKEPGGGAMMYDMVVVRPIGLVATAVGSVFWLISLPFSASGDNVDTATEKLVKEPAAYTFDRPLGEF
jgi:ABC-type microcin C transport system permease subunit YejB